MSELDLALWGVQGFLALFFVAGGVPKVIGRGLDRWTGFADLPRAIILVTGIAEVLGGLALVLPMATGVLPGLTPLAALGLAVIVLMATGFHVREEEHLDALETTLWTAIAIGVAIGRWELLPDPNLGPWLLVALGVLVPAVVINLAVLWRSGDDQGQAVAKT
jgi:hypothetical protein